MKYEVIDIVNGDNFNKGFETEKEALEYAEAEWNHLSAFDKKRREAFYVLECQDEDEESERHLDGNIVNQWK